MEKEPNEIGVNVDDTTQDYIAAIKELKENSVDRSKYEALRTENKKLLETVINGQQPSVEVQNPKYRDSKELASILTNENTTNLEYWTAFLELRDKIIEETGKDPCVTGGRGPYGKIKPEYGEAEATAEQMDIIRECIRIADGNEQVFINETSKRAR